MKNILLVEPSYKTKILPLGLQKMATYFLNRGDNVKYVKGIFNKPGLFDDGFYPDEIYLTTAFTYHADIVIPSIKTYQKRFLKSVLRVGGIFASLMPEYIENKTGIRPHIGLLEEVENCCLNFSLFPKTDQAEIFTTRGCIRKCEFCAVHKIEPKFYVHENWQNQINDAVEKNSIKKIMIQDNNFLASPFKHQQEVTSFLEKRSNKIEVDFNQGLDCRIFKEKHAQLLSGINTPVIRFAFDGMHEDGYFQEAMNLAKKYNIAKEYRIYVLYNFMDTPEDFWYRVKECLKAGAKVFPMRYSPLDHLKRNAYIGENWTKDQIKNLTLKFLNWAVGFSAVLSPDNKKVMEQIGETKEAFLELINTKQYPSFEKRNSDERRKKTGFNLSRDS